MDTLVVETFKPKVYTICLTGGPCAGKTTSISVLKERLSERFILYFLPEVASMTVHSGVTIIPSEFTPDTHKVFTEGIMRMQMDLEDYFKAIASIQKKDVLIICDRGCIDNLAYCTPEVKDRVLSDNGWKLETIRDLRYDSVIHLVTAADGAEEFYTLSNNSARTETPEVAKWLDQRGQEVWNGHPNHTVIGNKNVKNFQEKMEQVYKNICRTIGIQERPSFIKKYLLEDGFGVDQLPQTLSREVFKETLNYLEAKDKTELIWVKKRSNESTKGETYSHTTRVLREKEEERLELMRNITRREYENCLDLSTKKRVLNKEITVFCFDNQTCHVEKFFYKEQTICCLRLFLMDPTVSTTPPFLKVVKEVTEDPTYFSHNMPEDL